MPSEKFWGAWDRGVHSNLPTCCILWFATVRRKLPRIWRWNQYKVLLKHPAWVQHGYVRCPKCFITRHTVDQHMCDDFCRQRRKHAQ
jgi:hypothetical protein